MSDTMNSNMDKINEFFEKAEVAIKNILEIPYKPFNYDELDLLDSTDDETIKQIKEGYKRKQKTMRYGDIWQTIMGHFPGWEDLGVRPGEGPGR